MQNLDLPQVTLLAIDCIDLARVEKAFNVCDHYCNFAEKKLLTSLSSDSFKFPSGTEVVEIDKIDSSLKYSHFVMKRLSNYVRTDFVFIVQHDGYILNPNAWTDEFLKYDYIGAPWWYNDDFNVGNGGFSLRSKKLLEILQDDENIKVTDNEDKLVSNFFSAKLQ